MSAPGENFFADRKGLLAENQDVARGVSTSIPKHLLPFPSEFNFDIPAASITNVERRMNSVLENLYLQWQYRGQISTGVGFATANVWSRAARRQQKKKEGESIAQESGDEEEEDDDDEEEEPALGFKIQLRMAKESEGVGVMVRWLQGRESVLFESFCGMLKRQIS
ncbi:MAG: hypothetical protein Q9224_006417 [Gallowayella concinna]